MNDEQVMHALGLDDAYRVERVLARGAGGVTELVTIDGSGPFVRRRIPTKLARRAVWAELAECSCARLPRVQATYEMPDEFVVVCDFVPGETLEQLVAANGSLGTSLASRYMLELCEAVSELHEHRVIHRDISPANVVVAADGAHLIDLGIARMVVEGATKDTTQLGTWGFASPEQYGFAQTDARSDVYSLGRLLGFLLTGVRPDADEYERLLADAAVVPPQLRGVIAKACAFEPSARYQSAAALAAALGEMAPLSAASSWRSGVDMRCADASGNKGKDASQAFERYGFVPTQQSDTCAHDGFDFKNRVSVEGGEMAVAVDLMSGTKASAEPNKSRRWFLPTLTAAMVALFVCGAVIWGSYQQVDEETMDDSGFESAGSPVSAIGAVSSGNVTTPEIVESGWTADSDGYVHYAFALKNSNDGFAIDFPEVVITGYAQDDSILFSQPQVLSTVGPGETSWYAGLAGDGGAAPARVEFSPSSPTDYQVRSAGEGSTGILFEVSNVSSKEAEFDAVAFTGKVTKTADDGSSPFDSNQAVISVVLRDESGSIVGGVQDFVSLSETGASTTFETLPYKAPSYASFEVYAEPWL